MEQQRLRAAEERRRQLEEENRRLDAARQAAFVNEANRNKTLRKIKENMENLYKKLNAK